jgi:hypothetical protein
MLDDFSRVLRFKPHLLVLDAGPDTLFIVDETRRSVLRGAVYVGIASCLRERMTIAQTIAALSAQFSDWQVLTALDHLARQAYIRSDAPHESDVARGFFERTGLDGDRACDQLAQLSVAVEAFGVDPAPQTRALAAGGIVVNPDASFVIALVDSYERRELTEVTERTLARGGSVLVVLPYGIQPLIGPLLSPAGHLSGDTPCLACLRYWTSLNQPVQRLLARHHGDDALRQRSRCGAGPADRGERGAPRAGSPAYPFVPRRHVFHGVASCGAAAAVSSLRESSLDAGAGRPPAGTRGRRRHCLARRGIQKHRAAGCP